MFHVKKIKKEYFLQIIKGQKPFEVRLNDCNYQIDDIITLLCFDGDNFTGDTLDIQIKEIWNLDFFSPNLIAFTFWFV